MTCVFQVPLDGGTRIVVSTTAFHDSVRGLFPGVTVSDYPPDQVTPGGTLKLVSSYPL